MDILSFVKSKQAASSAVDETARAQLADIVYNVKNFKQSGETDWALAINRAIQQAISSKLGGKILVPPNCEIYTPVILDGVALPDSFDVGGITLCGTNMRVPTLIQKFEGSAVIRKTSMMINLEDLYIKGYGKGTNSIGLEIQGTGGSTLLNNVYISDCGKGITTYDVTLMMANNLNIRKCTKGIEGQWQTDILTFIGSRFDYCDQAIYIGGTSAAHTTTDQQENCWKFIGCRISNNAEGVHIVDISASNIEFDNCYFEGNIKEGSLAGTCIRFNNCFWTAYSTTTQGYIITTTMVIEVYNSYIGGTPTSPYNPFLDLQNPGSMARIAGCITSNVTALFKYANRAYSIPNVAGSELLMNSKQSLRVALDQNPIYEPPYELIVTGATGKKMWSVKKCSSTDESVIAETWVKDVGGKVELGGTGVCNKLPITSGTTANRPTGIVAGFQYFDTTLNKPIWYNGTAWVDSTGTTV